MRIAFFGGSFDPPHIGHLRIALAAVERLHLDRLLIAPVAVQPLKREGPPSASYADRLAMLHLLLDSGPHPNMAVSELDAPRDDGQPNYTCETLLDLRAQLTPEDKLFVLLGADSFLSMRHWHRALEVLQLADWIVAGRPGFSLHQLDQALPPSIHPNSAHEQHDGYTTQQFATADGRAITVHLLLDLCEDVAATAIRAAIAESSGILRPSIDPVQKEVLAPAVAAYIQSHGLYRGTGADDEKVSF